MESNDTSENWGSTMHCQRRTFNGICQIAKAIKLNFVDNEFFRGK